jgi:hypothetical protein
VGQVEVFILPKRLHVEVIRRGDESLERYFLHLIFRNRTSQTIRAERVTLILKSQAGDSKLLQIFEGNFLQDLFATGQPFVGDGEGTLEIPPEQSRGIIEYQIQGNGALHFTEAECLFQGLTSDGRTVERRQQKSVSRDSARTTLLLPLRGRWWVAGGHFNLEPHSRSHLSALSYAYDFIQLGDGGKSYRNDGRKNSDYYSYGQPVLAAATGRVITSVDGIEENVPSHTPGRNPESYRSPAEIPISGNHVVIQHAEDEHTFYAHLQPCLNVSVNQHVKAGDVIGKVGNSGESTEPHLHFHLADGASLESSNGIPITFEGWKEDAFSIIAAPVERGTVLSREIIESLE